MKWILVYSYFTAKVVTFIDIVANPIKVVQNKARPG